MPHRRSPYRYRILLLSLLILVLLYPILFETGASRYFFSILLFASLAAGIYAVSANRRVFWLGIGFGLLSFASDVASNFMGLESLIGLDIASSTAFFILLILVLFRDIFRRERVTADSVAGAVCIYLLLGITWTFIYVGIELFSPGAFSAGERVLLADSVAARQFLFSHFLYYSFVTLTTLGYGDFTPLAPLARTSAVVEAVLGQMYIAILVAQLVARHITQSPPRKE